MALSVIPCHCDEYHNTGYHSPSRAVLNSLLFTVRGAKPGKNVQLQENEIRGLCLKSREIFLSQPILLELEAPLKICGKVSESDSKTACVLLRDIRSEFNIPRIYFRSLSLLSRTTVMHKQCHDVNDQLVKSTYVSPI